MKLHRHTSHENDGITTHQWSQFVPDDVEHDDIIYIMNEYICICCGNSLGQKKQKCLTSHMPYGLQFHDIPQDLQKILPLERRVISP